MDNIYIIKEDLKDSPATYELFNKLFKQDVISLENIIVELENAYGEIEYLKEKIEDIEDNIRDNYKQISPYEYYGVSRDDFV